MRNQLSWPTADEPVSEEYIDKIGSRLNVHFTKDYKTCAAKNNGSAVIPYEFDVGQVTRTFGTLLSYDKSSNEFILRVYNNYKNTLPKDVIPFAYDPAGNLICFDYKGSDTDPIVVFWEHEGAAEKSMLINNEGMTEEEAERTARENIYYVADSFTDFLNQLYDSEE
ncbi:SMI1/KNR4 family protein [Virgibacillus sp. MSJ-26]|uniref:SMI1/KNR4 family protein n=1 Tax=Virgibacillus sp. MSJ-26 TaxID=2841522 RepID=UPI001C11441D|nr:SMI1/KNR4 family protein [Virgibacillus sp. MSJ-26]MBU5465784.1 SMI1/KNR4 family protein [Virgibacillus sp. MSJ-26]